MEAEAETIEQVATPKRGGRPTNAERAARAAAAGAPMPAKVSKEVENVTYLPREGDPSFVVWDRHKFQAGTPRVVKDPTLIAKAKANPWFEVEGHERAKSYAPPPVPKTSEQYRIHAIAWINAATDPGEMRQLWLEEAKLRDACGFGSDDLERVMAIYQPKFAQLEKFKG